MRQALHILGKDARYLHKEICLFLCLCALFAWGELHLPIAYILEALVMLAMIHLLSRAIHAEAMGDDRQFWLTRPYRWQSLLQAKLLFVAIFLITPMAMARLVVLQQQGYPVASSLPALAWWTLLTFFGAAIPVAAVAALTSGPVQFSLSMFGAATVAAIGFLAAPVVLRNSFGVHVPSWPPGLAWLQTSTFVVFLMVPLGFVLWWQYRSRDARLIRRYAAGLAGFALIVFFFVPVRAGLALQCLLSRGAEPPVRLSIGKSQRAFGPPGAHEPNWRVPLVLEVAGLPPGMDLQADYLGVSIEWGSQERWSETVNPSATIDEAGHSTINALLSIPAEVFQRNWGRPASIKGFAYLTSFGNAQRRTVPISEKPANLQEGLQCSSGPFRAYVCRAYFGWPSRLVLSEDSSGLGSFSRIVSYSPIPAGFGLDTQESRHTTLLPGATEVTVITKRPLAHFRRDFEAHAVRVGDLIAR